MKLFLGESGHALDERSRMTLPRKIRQEVEDRKVILARGFEVCIFGFDKVRWENEAEKNLESPVTDKKGRELRRYLFSAAEKVDIDKLGRIVIPPQLKEYAKIQKDIVVIGAGDHFEIWSMQKWEEYYQRLNEYERIS